jgi:hypothetical protein
MMDGLDEATHVILVCTETYYRRFRGHEQPPKGKGSDWEGAIITQELYDARSRTNRFFPVIFHSTDEKYVPDPLRGHTFHLLDSEAHYETFYDAILNQGHVRPGPVGLRKRKTPLTGQPLGFHEDDNSKPALKTDADALDEAI